MVAIRLDMKQVEKPWGRRDLPAPFGEVPADREPVGEVWFSHPDGDDAQLLVKYLFTSEKLSIQVHPDDEAARAAGFPRGKDEAWIILGAEAGATIGIGFKEPMTSDELYEAALDGSIEHRLDWRPVEAGDVLYSPGGTVHAIGAGLSLIEIQQNLDLTYRLFDYGRPRELHLVKGVAVANPAPYEPIPTPAQNDEGRAVLVEGPAFVVERWRGPTSAALNIATERPVWLILISGGGRLDGATADPGSVWLLDGKVQLALDAGSDVLLAYPGAGVANMLVA